MNRKWFGTLPITTRSSEQRSWLAGWTGQRWICLVLLGGILLSGCAAAPPLPEQFFQLAPASARHKALQTRMVTAADQRELLSASAAVLQDLGFHIEESVGDFAMLRAAKERGAREYGQEIARVFIFLLSALGRNTIVIPVDVQQQIAATLVVFPEQKDASRYRVRVVFFRKIWKSDGSSGGRTIPPGRQRMEMIYDPLIYQQFYAKLSKSMFLGIHQI